MADARDREAWITGIGIVSCLGEGPDAHWQGLSSGHPQADTTTYPPYVIHKIGPIDFDKQIPKKGDQRQMEPWQRLGTYAAGLALDSAGIKGNADILSRTDMIVAAGQSDIALVGGGYNAERPDLLMLYEFGGYSLKDKLVPVWDREANPGFALGSLGAFLVIESRKYAEARGARRLARLSAVHSDWSRRKNPGDVNASLGKLWSKIAGSLQPGKAAVISGASGAEPATAEERAFLDKQGGIAVRGTGTYLGFALEPQFPMNVALAAIAVSRGSLFPPGAASERKMDGPLTQAVVTAVGHWRGEGLALVESAP
jgi:3-oxoacyl-[acyl-carrier-protein] synthase II